MGGGEEERREMDDTVKNGCKPLLPLPLWHRPSAATSVPSRRKPLQRNDLRKTPLAWHTKEVAGGTPNACPQICLGYPAGVFVIFQK